MAALSAAEAAGGKWLQAFESGWELHRSTQRLGWSVVAASVSSRGAVYFTDPADIGSFRCVLDQVEQEMRQAGMTPPAGEGTNE